MISIDDSYRHCVAVARKRARNFYYSFLLLPKPKRLAMCAIYAFMRECDDLSDEPREGGIPASRAAIEQWRLALDQTLTGTPAAHPVWPAFLDTVQRYRIPASYFHEMIDGVSSDLEPRSIQVFDDLYHYCYLVASVVGLTIIHIFQFEDPHATELAEKCGIAFQLTNIIRDVKEDAGNNRVYIPGLTVAQAQSPSVAPHLRDLGARARLYYDQSRPLIGLIHADSRPSLWALMEIYRRLLDRIESANYQVLNHRIRLSALEKTTILLQAALKSPEFR